MEKEILYIVVSSGVLPITPRKTLARTVSPKAFLLQLSCASLTSILQTPSSIPPFSFSFPIHLLSLLSLHSHNIPFSICIFIRFSPLPFYHAENGSSLLFFSSSLPSSFSCTQYSSLPPLIVDHHHLPFTYIYLPFAHHPHLVSCVRIRSDWRHTKWIRERKETQNLEGKMLSKRQALSAL